MRYATDFGSANTGGSPAFTQFKRADTFVDLTQPTIFEIGAGLYGWDFPWPSSPTYDSVSYKATLAGIESSDTFAVPVVGPGTTNPNVIMDFGAANAGGTPTRLLFKDLNTLVDVAAPSVIEIANGKFYFPYNWNNAPAGTTSIVFKWSLGGAEQWGVINGPTYSVALPDFDTAANVINRTALQLGILPQGVVPSTAPDPFSSTDPNMALLCDLVTSAEDRLQSAHDWPQLRREYTFTTSSSLNTYPLPSDFHEMIDQTGWNRSNRIPLAGPASPQEWQYLKSRAPSLLINVVFRQSGGVMDINPGATPPAGAVVAYEYISCNWVQSQGQSAPDKSAPTIGTDVLWFDSELMIAALKLEWLVVRGFDTQKAEERYQEKLDHCIEKSIGAVTLSMDGAPRGTDRLIDGENMPITGYLGMH